MLKGHKQQAYRSSRGQPHGPFDIVLQVGRQGQMVIDVCQIETLPSAAREIIAGSDALLRQYREDDLKIEASKPGERIFWQRRSNAFAEDKNALEAALAASSANEKIRSFHYSRMTDEEIKAISQSGIVPTSRAFLRQRLDGLVAGGHMNAIQADEVFTKSAVNSGETYGARDGLFWTSAFPMPIDDSGVERLLAIWGGEVASWTLSDN